jgi:hypothetical protein
MGNREDHMKMITRQQPRLLVFQPALFLKIRTLRTRSMPTRVVPHSFHMAVGTFLHMTAKRHATTVHDRSCGSPMMLKNLVRSRVLLKVLSKYRL